MRSRRRWRMGAKPIGIADASVITMNVERVLHAERDSRKRTRCRTGDCNRHLTYERSEAVVLDGSRGRHETTSVGDNRAVLVRGPRRPSIGQRLLGEEFLL